MNTKTNFIHGALRILLALVFSLALIGIPSGRASAAGPFVVNSDGDGSDASPGDGTCEIGAGNGVCTLRAALQEANAFAGADTIYFSADMTITLGSELPPISQNLTIDGTVQDITIDGNNLYRVMTIGSDLTATLNSLSLKNGLMAGMVGGGLFFNASNVTVTNCTFSGNDAWIGAAISHVGGTLTVTNSTFSGNNATNMGGGIFTENGTVTVTDSTFSGNSADSSGGGIAVYLSTVSVKNSTFSGNSATSGGGIYNYQTTTSKPLTVTNSTFSGNGASDKGGGIFSDAGMVRVTNTTFSGNGATVMGGGVYIASGTFNLANTILANSTSGGDCYNSGTLASNTRNLIENTSTCGIPYSSADPVLGPLADNGGLTQTFALLAGSPAIDAGDNATCAAAPVSNKDQRGVNRPNGSACDIGAYEYFLPTISGNVGIAGATLGYFDGASQSAVADGSGNYSFIVSYNWSGAVTPSKPNYTFSPDHLDYGNLQADATDQNYTAIPVTSTATYKSIGAQDGWILESAEGSNVGGTLNTAATTFNLGDEAGDKQYRAVLSFNTASLADTAVITKVTLKIKRPATGYLVGNNSPFTWGTGLKVDVCRTFFGTTVALQLGDFNFNNATNCKLLVGAFGGTPVAYWYSANILSTAFARINKTGTTQFRLRFAKDDNDDGNADNMKFYSGNYSGAASRPALVIEYYVP